MFNYFIYLDIKPDGLSHRQDFIPYIQWNIKRLKLSWFRSFLILKNDERLNIEL